MAAEIDIIVAVWNQSELTVKCFESIRQHTKNYRLIVINNASEGVEWEAVGKELFLHENAMVINNTENVGFVKAVNQGLRHVTGKYVVLMNNDTEAVEGWVEKLMEPLLANRKIMLSGPLTTTPDSWQGRYPKGQKGWVIRDRGMLAFFCTMFKAEIFKIAGALDETFGVGFGDDDDYCMRVRKKGYLMALVQDLVIPHHHRSTFRKIYSDEQIKQMQDKARQKFKVKHGLR